MGGGEMHEPVRVERVSGASDVEAKVEPLAGGHLRHVILHLDRLAVAHPVFLGQVGGAVTLALARRLGVELEAAPGHAHLVTVLEGGQGGLEAALADVTPGARDVGPDFDVHGNRR